MERPEYFQGILQLRNPNEVVIKFIEKELSRQESRGIRISKIKEVGKGVDIFLTSQRYLQVLAKHLKHRFGGELKVSSQLHTQDRQTSKGLYRVNVYYEVPPLMQGETVSWDKGVGIIKKYSNKKCIVFDLKQNCNTTVLITELRKETTYKTTVSTVKPKLEVLHPETYQSVVVENHADVVPGQNVKVVIWKERVFIV